MISATLSAISTLLLAGNSNALNVELNSHQIQFSYLDGTRK